jgi:hypothetical protein
VRSLVTGQEERPLGRFHPPPLGVGNCRGSQHLLGVCDLGGVVVNVSRVPQGDGGVSRHEAGDHAHAEDDATVQLPAHASPRAGFADRVDTLAEARIAGYNRLIDEIGAIDQQELRRMSAQAVALNEFA